MVTSGPIAMLLRAEEEFLRSYGWKVVLEENGPAYWLDPKNGDKHVAMWSALAVQKVRVDYP